MEQFLTKTIYWHMKNKNLIVNIQHRSAKSKSCLTDPIDFYGGMTGFADEGGGMGDRFDLRKAFSTVSF